jgi:SAM-dependent methyltransferase
MTTEAYYDRLTAYYKFIYADWGLSVVRQAEALDSVIREHFGAQAHRILDAACGIGTQSIGLAQRGYQVTGSDISLAEVEEARTEAVKRGLPMKFKQADMLELRQAHEGYFDVVIACDNAIPHLLSDDAILNAFRQFYECVQPGGGCLISVRDYASMDRTGQQLIPRQVHRTERGRVVLFDVWDFEGDFYNMSTYIVEDGGGGTGRCYIVRGRYYCVEIEALERLMAQAGFVEVQTLRDRFFQPLIIGRR